MDKDYRKISFMAGNTVESAVNELLKYQNIGIKVYGEFNGVKLYSDTVTMDEAYVQIIGKTKKEFDEDQQKWRDDYKKKEEEHKENIPSLSSHWINKGKEVLSEDKWALWEEIVPIRLDDLYRGMELGQCLEIVAALNSNRPLAEANRLLDNQNHSGMSYGLMKSMIREFSNRGEEFLEYIKE